MKYGNQKTTIDGITFDSKLEAQRYQELKLLQRAGEISCLKTQVAFQLLPSFRKNGKTYRATLYVADFTYYDHRSKKNIVEDTKGYKTQLYRLKKKIFEYTYPDLTIKEVTK